MAKNETYTRKKAATITRTTLDEQMEEFLKKGGEVELVDRGTSGVKEKPGPAQLVLSNFNKKTS